MLLSGTVLDIPFPLEASPSLDDDHADLPYTILFDNGATLSIPLLQMAAFIPSPPVIPSGPDKAESLLPPFLCLNSQITFEHDGQYHKDYLGLQDGIYHFLFVSHKQVQGGLGHPIANLPTTWVDLCVESVLVPSHVSHSFLHLPTSSAPTTLNPVPLFVSAINLHCNCPPSLLKALADSHPDREVWLESFLEEKHGIRDLDTFKKISLSKYQALREKCASHAIPTLCVFTIKKDKKLFPLRTKSRILILGNHKD